MTKRINKPVECVFYMVSFPDGGVPSLFHSETKALAAFEKLRLRASPVNQPNLDRCVTKRRKPEVIACAMVEGDLNIIDRRYRMDGLCGKILSNGPAAHPQVQAARNIEQIKEGV